MKLADLRTTDAILEQCSELYGLSVDIASRELSSGGAAAVRAGLAVLEFAAQLQGLTAPKATEIVAVQRSPEELAAQVLRGVADACRVLGVAVPSGLPSGDASEPE